MSPAFWTILIILGYLTMVWVTRVTLDLIPLFRREFPGFRREFPTKDLLVFISLFWFVLVPLLGIGWLVTFSIQNFMKSAEAVAHRIRENRELS